MKYILCVLLFSALYSYGQEEDGLAINDHWYNDYGSKGLKIGDTMPDIDLGTVLNNYTGKSKFSEFKGKLIILDFWSTYCSSCIAMFPHMEALQKEFGDSIQIFLVNTGETEKQIREREKYLNQKRKQKITFPNLPSIVTNSNFSENDSSLFKLFPKRGVPHHVWIDGNGIIRLIGGPENTYSDKIRDLLGNKDIFVLRNDATVPNLLAKEGACYYKLLNNTTLAPVSYGSFITPFNNGIGRPYGDRQEIIDSAAGVRINYFVNQELMDIYHYCINKLSLSNDNKIIYNGNWSDFVIFHDGIDTLRYTTAFLDGKRYLTDSDITKVRFCYEQIVPLTMSDKKRWQYMLEDLNRYFEQKYQSVVKMERRNIPYGLGDKKKYRKMNFIIIEKAQ